VNVNEVCAYTLKEMKYWVSQDLLVDRDESDRIKLFKEVFAHTNYYPDVLEDIYLQLTKDEETT